jgi:hypothetical protein
MRGDEGWFKADTGPAHASQVESELPPKLIEPRVALIDAEMFM